MARLIIAVKHNNCLVSERIIGCTVSLDAAPKTLGALHRTNIIKKTTEKEIPTLIRPGIGLGISSSNVHSINRCAAELDKMLQALKIICNQVIKPTSHLSNNLSK